MKKLLTILALLTGFLINAQVTKTFSKDSLNGFDEKYHNYFALSNQYFHKEYTQYMERAKRNYINTKYGINPNTNLRPPSNTNSVLAAPCVNEDFEATPNVPFTTVPQGGAVSNPTGWTITSGQNGTFFNNIYYTTCSVSAMPAGIFVQPVNECWVRSTPIADPNFPGGIPNSPLGGTKVLQLNDNLAISGQITRASQTFPVTSSNALFQFAYAACFNGTGHACCDQPFLNIKVKDCLGQVLACPQITVVASGPSCVNGNFGFATNTFGYLYKNWTVQSLDLTPYIGSCVTIEVSVGDCTGWAHFGYCYFDAVCKPITLQVNNNFFPAGTNSVTAAGCGTNTAVMTAPAGLGPYSWNGPIGSGFINNPNQTITTTVTGNYILTMNPPGACAPITKTINLSFTPNPISTFTNINVCNSYSFTNTGTPSPAIQTYSFIGTNPPNSYTTTNLTSNTTFTSNGTYTVQHIVTNTVGCTSTTNLVVNIPISPTLTINSFSICPNSNVALSVSGANSYTWSGGLGNTSSITVSPSVTTNYTVNGTNTSGCTASITTQILVYPTPTITVSSGTICLGNATLGITSGALTYTWFPGGMISNTPTLSPNVTTTYTVIGTSVNGCTNTATTQLIVNQLPTPTLTVPIMCTGVSSTVSAGGGISYQWFGPNFNSSLQNPVFINPTTANNGPYTLIVTDANGCSSTQNFTINVLPPFQFTVGSNSPLCKGDNLVLSAQSGYSYIWSGPNNFIAYTNNTFLQNVQPNDGGLYTVTAINSNGCSSTQNIPVVIYDSPIPSISSSPSSCAPACVTYSLHNNDVQSILWYFDNGATVTTPTTTQCFSKGGVYNSTVTLTDTRGCKGTNSYTTAIYNVPTADFIFTPLKPMEGENVTFTDASFGANITTWNWYFQGQSVDTLKNVNHIYDEKGQYVVTLVIKSDKGCSDTITKVVSVKEDYSIFVPNTFTPNGDGVNDIFQPKGHGITKYQLMIFDRWGEMIYETKEFNQGWDGKHHKGIDYRTYCKDDVYIWKILFIDVFGVSHEITGHVNLIK